MSSRRLRALQAAEQARQSKRTRTIVIVVIVVIVVLAIIGVVIFFVLRSRSSGTSGSGGGASNCTSNADCPLTQIPFCNTTTGACVQCLSTSDCDAGETCVSGICQAPPSTNCVDDSDCTADANFPRCDLGSGTCVACIVDGDCDTMEICVGQTCQAVSTLSCTTDTDCSGIAAPSVNPRPNCDLLKGKCQVCFNDADCTSAPNTLCLQGGCVDPSDTICEQLAFAYQENPDVSVDPGSNYPSFMQGAPATNTCDPAPFIATYNFGQSECADDVLQYTNFLNTLSDIPSVQANNPQTDWPNFRNKFPFTLGCAQQPYIDAYNARIAALTPNDVKLECVNEPGRCICHPLTFGGTGLDDQPQNCACSDPTAVWRLNDVGGGKKILRIPPGQSGAGRCAAFGNTVGSYTDPECLGATPTDPDFTAGINIVDIGGGQVRLDTWEGRQLFLDGFWPSFPQVGESTDNCASLTAAGDGSDNCKFTVTSV